jgi:hypothetical protein
MTDIHLHNAVLGGADRLLDAPGISIDRMPMLQVVLDRMAAECSENLRQLSAAPAFFSVDAIAAKRLGDVLDAFENNVAIGIFYVQAWDSRILIGLDHNFVFTLAEALFAAMDARHPLRKRANCPVLNGDSRRRRLNCLAARHKAHSRRYATLASNSSESRRGWISPSSRRETLLA